MKIKDVYEYKMADKEKLNASFTYEALPLRSNPSFNRVNSTQIRFR